MASLGPRSPSIVKNPIVPLVLNVDNKFEKLTALTTDGNTLKFFGHLSDRHGQQKKIIRVARHGKDSKIRKPVLAEKPRENFNVDKSALSPRFKEEQTKSMQKYQRELEFKNRVLREKEKAVFNEGMMKKLNSSQISTVDLKSERTLTNHRQSKKHLATVNSSGSINEAYSQMQMANQDIQNID